MEARGLRRPFDVASFFFYRHTERGLLAARVSVLRRWVAVWADLVGSLGIVCDIMFVPDTFLSLAITVASVLVWSSFSHLAMDLTWTAVSFMLIFPIQNALKEAFGRREHALASLAVFRAATSNVYLANVCWDWPGADGWHGRLEDNLLKELGGYGMKKQPNRDHPLPKDHQQRVKQLLERVIDSLQELLLVPRNGRSRFELPLAQGAMHIERAERQGRAHVVELLTRLHRATEDLKAAGLPANEASRINQYNLILMTEFERLWTFKTYRTSNSLRAVARISIHTLPCFYGPYFVRLSKTAHDTEGHAVSLTFVCCFASLISMMLVAMFNLVSRMENPFRHGSRDTIRVKEEMQLCREALDIIDAGCTTPWYSPVVFSWELDRDTSIGEDEEGSCSDDNFAIGDASTDGSYDPVRMES
eukprot:TRINITY_DN4657_c0_g3_i1.p1 TRINITY_DN4657_c0_g3~~TRINITY_DN4657_c0_g3_i1.p1  ORF type:complete len:433 (+),score=62.38 TRINITY_DN4657_c0_g3_i1:48-1301(+)